MRGASRFSMLTLGLAIVLGLSSTAISMADDTPAPAPAAATGTISGKVLDSTGAAAKGVKVSAYSAKKRVRGEKREALSTATTGEDGTYKLLNVPAGEVIVTARGDKEEGHVKGKTTVTAGEDTAVADIKLAARKMHKAKRAAQ